MLEHGTKGAKRRLISLSDAENPSEWKLCLKEGSLGEMLREGEGSSWRPCRVIFQAEKTHRVNTLQWH